MSVAYIWSLPITEWNRLMHALHGNTAAAAGGGLMVGLDADYDDDLEGLGELEHDERYELEVSVGGAVRLMPFIALWQSDDGSAAAAVPAWAVPHGAEILVGATVGGGDAPLPPDVKVAVRFVQLSAEMMARATPFSGGASP